MAPMISNSKNSEEKINLIDKDFKNKKNELIELRRYIENNFEYVGKDFSKKVREVYYDKKIKKVFME